MTASKHPISPDDIFVRTAAGSRAAFDPGRALSAGFREMLKALDGKCSVEQLAAVFPQLDQEDLALWLEELRRQQLIEFARIPFELPEVPAVKPASAKPGVARHAGARPGSAKAASASAATGSAVGEEFNFDEMAANVADWVKESTESFAQVRPAELNKTIQMATLQSSQTLENLEGSGFVANLMEPINFKEDVPAAPAARPSAAAPRKAPAVAAAPRQAPAAAAHKKTAMLFEDDANDLRILALLIEAAGYRVRASSTRQQFVTLLNSGVVPDVMFLKLGSKDVDGFKALEKLRLHPRLKEVAVVMTAAKPTREDIAKSILLGASGWMIKPYSADVIAAAVQGVLAFPTDLSAPTR
jgi:CheY-like chemotaxis protein